MADTGGDKRPSWPGAVPKLSSMGPQQRRGVNDQHADPSSMASILSGAEAWPVAGQGFRIVSLNRSRPVSRDRHDPGIGQGRLPQLRAGVGLAASWLGNRVGVHAKGITQLRKTIRPGHGSPEFRQARTQEVGAAPIPPPPSTQLPGQRWETSAGESAFEVAKHDVAVLCPIKSTQPERKGPPTLNPARRLVGGHVRGGWSGG